MILASFARGNEINAHVGVSRFHIIILPILVVTPPFFGTTTWEFAIWETCTPGWTLSLLCQPRGRGSRRRNCQPGAVDPNGQGNYAKWWVQLQNQGQIAGMIWSFHVFVKFRSTSPWESLSTNVYHMNVSNPYVSVSGYLPCLVWEVAVGFPSWMNDNHPCEKKQPVLIQSQVPITVKHWVIDGNWSHQSKKSQYHLMKKPTCSPMYGFIHVHPI